MRKITFKIGIVLFAAVLFCGCEEVKDIANMLNCTFERKDITNFRFAGVNFDKFNSFTDIKGDDIVKIGLALAQKTAPITFDMNVEGKNPTTSKASLEEFAWIFLLDGNEVINGNIPNKFSIPADGSNILPVEISFDAWKYLDGSTPQSLFNFYQNLTGKNASKESNAILKIKPTINGIKFPNYLTLKQTVN